MNVLVFDQQVPAKAFWQNFCDSHKVSMRSFDSIPNHILEPNSRTRILIVDQSVIGIDLTQAIELCRRAAQDILVFTGENLCVASAVQLMREGAAWVFSKEFDEQSMHAQFAAILKSAELLKQQVDEYDRLQALISEISPREKPVLDLVLDGIPNKQIAKQLQVSVRTVESRRAKIYRKCQVRSVTELVRRVDQAELLKQRFGDCRRNFTGATRSCSNSHKPSSVY